MGRLHWLPALLLMCAGVVAAAPAPPSQPARGPGGADYRHRDVVAASYGSGATQYWVFEPAGPVPKSAPVIVFLHGWGAVSPEPYRAWIDHIVRRGNIVIYPRYQADLRTPVNAFTPNAIASITGALDMLRGNSKRLAPDLKRFALIGHSVGGVLCANIAARAHASGLPPVLAFMSVQPGKTRQLERRAAIVLDDLAVVPASTLIITTAGDRDRLVRDTDARRIYAETTQVPPRNKNFIMVASDAYGAPPLEAHHFSPLARAGAAAPAISEGRRLSDARERMLERGGARGDRQPDPTRPDDRDPDDVPDVGAAIVTTADALDFFGYWKLLDALVDTAFYGRNREFALGNTPQQRYMGTWSDGRPVRELIIYDQP